MDPIPGISRLTYQMAYAASMLMPGAKGTKEARAAAFAAKAEANAQKHAPAGIAVALNLFVLGLLGTAKFREEHEKDAQAIEAVIDNDGFLVRTTPALTPGGGGGGAAVALAHVQITAPQTPTTLPSVLTTTAPSTITFNVPATTPSVTGLPSGLANGQGGSGTGSGTGKGTGTGPGMGSGTGGGNGAGNGQGTGNGVVDNRIPVILLHMGRETNLGRTVGWNAEESVKEWDKAMAIVKSQFRITEQIECGDTRLEGHIQSTAGEYRDQGIGGMLKFQDSTAYHLVEAVKRNKEAKAIIFLATWDDGRTMNGPSPHSITELINILRAHQLPMVLFNYMNTPGKHWNRVEIEVSEGSGGGGTTYSRLQETVAKVIEQPALPQIGIAKNNPQGFANPKLAALVAKLKAKGINAEMLDGLTSPFRDKKEVPAQILTYLETLDKSATP